MPQSAAQYGITHRTTALQASNVTCHLDQSFPFNQSMTRGPYNGSNRQLLLAFDIGVTFSGISYSILSPGCVPLIYSVKKFPGCQKSSTNAKIPSVIYYSMDGTVQAIGAEAERDDINIIAENEGWIRAEWIQHYLISSSDNFLPRPLKQLGKTGLDILVDFLKYLDQAAQQYIEEQHPGIGANILKNGETHYILSHPNGWGRRQQSMLRQAAQIAGFVTGGSTDLRKLSFIAEGEASLKHCIEEVGVMTDTRISGGNCVVVVDAGQSKIEISTYACLPDGNTYEEIAEVLVQCHVQGSAFVPHQARKYLQELLLGTRYSDDIPQLMEFFEKSTLHIFRHPGDPHFIPIPVQSRRFRDPRLGIMAGRLRLDGTTIASFFEPSIASITSSVLLRLDITHQKITHVFLVGSLSGNDYLFQQVRERLEKHGLKVFRPDTHFSKVVADGAISGALNHLVTSQNPQNDFGLQSAETYDFSPLNDARRKEGWLSFDHKPTPVALPVVMHDTHETRNGVCDDANPLGWRKSLRVSNTILPHVPEPQSSYKPRAPIDHPKLSLPVSHIPSQQYIGNRLELVLSFDVGTSHSAIAYSIRRKAPRMFHYTWQVIPGERTEDFNLRGERINIPSVLYYSKDGNVKAAGAETENLDTLAEENGWIKVECFKLGLRINSTTYMHDHAFVLPARKTVVEVFADFLIYLNKYAREYIEEVHGGIGSSLFDGTTAIHYVLPHPNGWESTQQNMLREAAKTAGLIGNKLGNRLTLIREGEASFDACLEMDGLKNAIIQDKEGIIIVDAGAATIDISAYAAVIGSKREFEEIAEPQCHLKGSLFVSRDEAKKHLESHLKNTKFGRQIPRMLRVFDETIKSAFISPNRLCYIQFGPKQYSDEHLRIVGGRLCLEGHVIASFFEPTIRCIVSGVLSQRLIAHKPISHVYVTGGFAGNTYLYNRIRDGLRPYGLTAHQVDINMRKSVARGAISAILNRPVRTRVPCFAIGVSCFEVYDLHDPEHIKRRGNRVKVYSGEMAITNIFSAIVHKNEQVPESKEFRCRYTTGMEDREVVETVKWEILCYTGRLTPEKYKWMDNDPENFRHVCTVSADLSTLPLPSYVGRNGAYREREFEIILKIGLTEMQAQLAWTENGVEKRGPVEITHRTNF